MKRFALSILLVLALAVSGAAQTATTSTTLSAAVTSVSATTFRVTSATGFVANTTWAYVDRELVRVLAVSGTTISVQRGANGTAPATHASSAVIYVGPFDIFRSYDPAGSCTATNERYLPQINQSTGTLWNCVNSKWQGTSFGPLAVSSGWPRTPVADAAYTVKLTDVIVGMTTITAARTVTLPAATGLDGKIYIIQDEGGGAGTYTITVAGTINGSTNYSLATNYGVVRVRSNGTAWFIW